jgi:hypothetical protein
VIRAQEDHSCTISAGGGWAPLTGKDSGNFNDGWNFQAGGGAGHWRGKWGWGATVDFMFDDLGVSQSALTNARILNTTNPGLLGATSANAKFYSTMLDPTVRVRASNRASVYFFGGFGWFRRNLEFTGTATHGTLLQPNNPVTFGNEGNSGGYDVGAGVNVKVSQRTGGLMMYGEFRVLHGLGINSSNTLIPISAGLRW